ncbi:MAG: hypothetical protein A3J07_03045 [Candidatus Doudnabacteria bacterium RIFCSPLOWO2_02_FULL_49_13]|uniref:Amidohydrolase 3 domain-containing protein n=1 Tax=Candidatus Doudnabacteria bacterium RIFCSPHIGHO2_12_FULL_48_16 TaxID=1817838 RepID=A0A1F5PLN3_9BACT|nr:MAG: hypothetical protein A3B77_01850 [Candidatus Doudnabacteria bacterium RIFCSPHIGHO2_02_FULL_49_24]OGE89448.1 MAG: hypothetical protein A2760_02425 [Candidatus Doudnabacteria bacterium RIFCSPHIGHO2_01_FULL_50_67]OGE90843.1 MAG: hypothetical protein A3E29_01585 [Candidatus Doudnabacteria bacterium RIFCSPHIGHO2_12_FULL_48_16]OGE97554.1 MAG: hypothetical protein A2990_02445 [Candidatus Doudnabacteria bacterium RIFCSPLOWO2_01_FULL_49_40]OGF03042.1 MAG: hypothetical protein A3J07_03045 [Candid
MLDILIKNGTVIDGTGSPAKKLDVAIEKGRLVELAPNIKSSAVVVIDASRKYVAPGFIDIQSHSDSYWTIFDQPGQSSMLSQGITTAVLGNCGSSLAPLVSAESIKTIQKWHDLSGININWTTFGEFLNVLSNQQLGVNVGSLVGHATIRRGILGDDIRQVTDDELKALEKLTANSLEQGALGLSFGLVYSHEVNSSAKELEVLTALLKAQNKYLSVHLRSESAGILESVDEVIALAKMAGVAVKISHLKIRDAANWHLFDLLINKLETAYHQGVKISFDVYPYDTSWSVLYTYLPKWAYEGGRDGLLKNIADPNQRRKILDYLRGANFNFSKIIIASSAGESLIGKTIAEIAANQSVSAAEAILNVLSISTQAIVFDHNLSQEQVEILCASPLSMIATDGAGYDTKQRNLVHPRCFGTMPRFLKLVNQNKLMNWEYAIKKITGEPANLLGLADRGNLAKNSAADVVIFDPNTIGDRADYTNPDLLSEGIEWVITNGKVSFKNGEVTGLNGMVVKR